MRYAEVRGGLHVRHEVVSDDLGQPVITRCGRKIRNPLLGHCWPVLINCKQCRRERA